MVVYNNDEFTNTVRHAALELLRQLIIKAFNDLISQ